MSQCTWTTIISGQSNVGARWLKHWAAGSWRSSLQYCEMYPLVFHLRSFRFSVTKCCFHVCQSVALITMLLIGHPASKPFGFSHDAHSMQLPRNSFTWITGDRRSDWWKSQTAQILSVGPMYHVKFNSFELILSREKFAVKKCFLNFWTQRFFYCNLDNLIINIVWDQQFCDQRVKIWKLVITAIILFLAK